MAAVLHTSFICLTTFAPNDGSSQAPAAKVSSADLLHAMASSSALDEVSAHPWHLKLDVTVFDATGKNPSLGTIDVWQEGENRRMVYQFGPSSRTELLVSGKSYYGSVGEAPLDIADEVLQGFLHPGPQDLDTEGATPELRTQNFGKQKFDCIMLSRPVRDMKAPPLGLFPTYCGPKESTDLRIYYPSGFDVLLRQRVGIFLEHHVTMELSISRGSVERAHAKLVSLAVIPVESEAFKVTDDLSPIQSGSAHIPAGVIAGAKVSGKNPMYPESARQAHTSGTVLLRAIIGVDGHIHTLRVVSTPDPDLAIASLAAVRTWQYKPYLLNGVPTSVDTTITVNFNLNSY